MKVTSSVVNNMYYLIIFYFLGVVAANFDSPVVQIISGLIEGRLVQSDVIDKSYYSFQGIPYAEPPIGNLRFKPPVKPKPWAKTLKTKADGSQCVQKTGGSEDCLFLNVYTTKLPSVDEKPTLLPVMVFIHGGAFVKGSSNSKYYGPEYLVEHDVVLVTLNYRLNVFGFLNALDDSAPGNAGLKDQLAALKWVQANIEKFSGDPKQVTIFGHSAGAASVQYILQSKLGQGLFNKVIFQSGSTLSSKAFEKNPLDVIQKFGALLNATDNNVTEIIHLLKNMSSKDLFEVSISDQLLDNLYTLNHHRFVPSTENESPESVFSESSYLTLSNNNINDATLMIGYVTNEALMFLEKIQQVEINLEEYEKNPNLLVSQSLNINDDPIKMKSAWTEIKQNYFYNTSVTNISAFINMESDETFTRGIRKSAELLRKYRDIFFYVFDFKNNDDNSEYPGVGHGAELRYLFNTGVNETKEDKLIRLKMTKLWTNFAKFGNPTPNEDSLLDNVTWPTISKFDNDYFEYLYIKNHLIINKNPEQENFEFWEKLFKKYGKAPLFTY